MMSVTWLAGVGLARLPARRLVRAARVQASVIPNPEEIRAAVIPVTVSQADITRQNGQGIKNNLGASVISTIAVADELASGELKAIPIEGVDLHRNFYMTYQKQRTLTPLAKLFMEFIEKGGSRSTEPSQRESRC